MNLNPFPDGEDDSIPVTVMLTPWQVARLEVITADLRKSDPSIDDSDVADMLFDTGLAAYESLKLHIVEPRS